MAINFRQNKEMYPEVLLSDSIHNILNERPTFPKPSKPIKPNTPIKPEKEDVHFWDWLSLLDIGGIIVLITLWNKFAIEVLFVIIPIIIVLGIGCIPTFFEITYANRTKFPEKMQEYNKAIKDFPEVETKYQNAMLNYQKAMDDYYSKMSTKLISYRKANIANFLKECSTDKINLQINSDKIKKGASEGFFLPYLSKIEGATILTNYKASLGVVCFYPDYILKIRNIIVDIEIDEPYIGNNGDPIHYLYDSYYGGKTSIDARRNEFFTNNNWCVIRFAEEQIFKHPDECVDFIVSVLNSILKADLSLVEIDSRLAVKKWTDETSHQLAYKRYRHSYVPQQYHHLIDVEEWSEKDEAIKEYKSPEYNIEDDLPF